MKQYTIKILLLIAFITLHPIISNAQIKISGYYDGYWGEWEDSYIFSLYGGRNSVDKSFPYLRIYGNYSGFSAYSSEDHPSEYIFKFQISNYIAPDKKTKKQHLKSKEWYEYSGIVEYFVTDKYNTAKEQLANGSIFGRIPAVKSTWPGAKKRTVNAKISIAPYEDHPKVYNIFFEGVGVGIDLNTIYFKQ